MSPTKSTAVATGTSNGRTFNNVYEMGSVTSPGAVTTRAVKLDERSGRDLTYCALNAWVIPLSKLVT
jgi:hypothetical protein